MALKVLTFQQSTGEIRDAEGAFIAKGWAGNHQGKNNPAMQAEHNIGPLPQGLYSVGAWEEQHAHLGPWVAHLQQIEGETFGRDAFYIHGAAVDPSRFGQESKGCIVIPRTGRMIVKAYAPDQIRVIA